MHRLRALIAVVALAAAVVPRGVGAAQIPQALTTFEQMFEQVHDYTVELHSHEVLGSRSQTRVYRYWFMKPHFAKTLILSGDGAGSGGVWSGGDTVSGHQGGILSHIHLTVSIHDPRATSLRGYTIPDGLIQNVVERYLSVKGRLSERPAGTIDGQPTTLVELDVANPGSDGGITKMMIFFSRTTHWPLRNIMYQGSTPVVDQSWTNLKVNTGLTQSDF
jgi:hypothetical protein